MPFKPIILPILFLSCWGYSQSSFCKVYVDSSSGVSVNIEGLNHCDSLTIVALDKASVSAFYSFQNSIEYLEVREVYLSTRIMAFLKSKGKKISRGILKMVHQNNESFLRIDSILIEKDNREYIIPIGKKFQIVTPNIEGKCHWYNESLFGFSDVFEGMASSQIENIGDSLIIFPINSADKCFTINFDDLGPDYHVVVLSENGNLLISQAVKNNLVDKDKLKLEVVKGKSYYFSVTGELMRFGELGQQKWKGRLWLKDDD